MINPVRIRRVDVFKNRCREVAALRVGSPSSWGPRPGRRARSCRAISPGSSQARVTGWFLRSAVTGRCGRVSTLSPTAGSLWR